MFEPQVNAGIKHKQCSHSHSPDGKKKKTQGGNMTFLKAERENWNGVDLFHPVPCLLINTFTSPLQQSALSVFLEVGATLPGAPSSVM